MPPLGLAIVAGYAIFLDYRADRYLLLEPALNDAVCHLAKGESVSTEALDELAEVLGRRPSPAVVAAMLVTVDRRRYHPAPAATASLAMKAAAIINLVITFICLKIAGLHYCLKSLDCYAGSNARRQPDDVDAFRIAGAHTWLSRYVTANEACLLRSIALARHAFLRGCRVHFVIGVKAHPFGAHCWVGADDVILNDDPDAVAPFEPILAIP